MSQQQPEIKILPAGYAEGYEPWPQFGHCDYLVDERRSIAKEGAQ